MGFYVSDDIERYNMNKMQLRRRWGIHRYDIISQWQNQYTKNDMESLKNVINSVVLLEGWTGWSMKQNKEFGNRPQQIWDFSTYSGWHFKDRWLSKCH